MKICTGALGTQTREYLTIIKEVLFEQSHDQKKVEVWEVESNFGIRESMLTSSEVKATKDNKTFNIANREGVWKESERW